MNINELLDISKDIRETLSEVRSERKLTFEEEAHRYTIHDPVTEQSIDYLPSVSSLLARYYEPFDALAVSIGMCRGNEEKAGILREDWEKSATDASSIGSYAHYKLEQYVWNLYDIKMDTRKPEYDLSNDDMHTAQEMLKNGVDIIHKIIANGYVPLDTETVMGSIDLGYFGQCDNLWLGIHKGNISILMTDYKTNKTKNFTEMPYNKPMLYPFGKLKDTALSKYYIQQPLYAQLLKDMLKNTCYSDIPIIGFRILHLRDGGNIYKIPQWVREEVEKIYPING